MSARRRGLMGAQSKTLPPTYQQVEYIGNTDNPNNWIDTGILPTNTFGFYAKVSRTDVTTDKTILQSRNNGSEQKISVGIAASHVWAAWGPILALSNNPSIIRTDVPFEIKFNYKNNRDITVDGISNIQNSLSELPYTPTYNFPALGFRGASSWLGNQLKVYGFEFTNGNDVIQKLIPCYRIGDGAIGFYDIIGHQFYGNSGTGNLIKGADV